jgi:hypothetical protein
MKWQLVGEFSALRRVTETDAEIVIEGHCGVAEVEEERFPKAGHKVEVTDLIRIYTVT